MKATSGVGETRGVDVERLIASGGVRVALSVAVERLKAAGGIPVATKAEVDGLDTDKAELAGSASQDFSASTVNATTVDLGDWTITQSGSDLKFAYNGTNRFSLSSSGALTVEANVTAYGSA